MIRATLICARLNIRRLLRGRSAWLVLLLMLMPILASAWPAGAGGAQDRFAAAVESVLRFLINLSAAVLLAGAVRDELEGKTYAYLWSRPFARPALLLGKLVAVAPSLAVVSTLSLVVAALISDAPLTALLRSIGAAALASVAASAVALGVAAAWPRHAMSLALFVLVLVEQVAWFIPKANQATVLFHSRVVAGLSTDPELGVASSALTIGVLAAAWLSLGIMRVMGHEETSG
ncbi:MAG: hypothetical protein HY698_01130 [Deltaproteobacteria bacterium]|nr:hypothetical protein [Deltaproteobacteria bacterium]